MLGAVVGYPGELAAVVVEEAGGQAHAATGGHVGEGGVVVGAARRRRQATACGDGSRTTECCEVTLMDYEKGYVYKLMDQGVHLLKCISAQTKAIPGGMAFVIMCGRSAGAGC